MNREEVPPVPPIPHDILSLEYEAQKRRSAAVAAMLGHEALHLSRYSQRINRRSDHVETRRPLSAFKPVVLSQSGMQQTSKQISAPSYEKQQQDVSTKRHLINMTAISLASFTVSLASSISAPASARYQQDYDVPLPAATLTHAVYLLGSACMSVSISLQIEHSSVPILSSALISLAIFTMLAAFIQVFSVIIIARLLAGVAGSAVISACLRSILSMHAVELRAMAISIFAFAIGSGLILGTFLCPLLLGSKDVAWLQFTILFMLAPTIIVALCTDKIADVRLALNKICHKSRAMPSFSSTRCLGRSQYATEQEAWLAATTIASIASVTFSLLQAIPYSFATRYADDQTTQACVVLALLCGVLFASWVLIAYHKLVYTPRRMAWEEKQQLNLRNSIRQSQRSRRVDERRSCPSPQSLAQPSADAPSAEPKISTQRLSIDEKAIDEGNNVTAGMAVAIADDVNDMQVNAGRHVLAEHICSIAVKHKSFEDVLDELEVEFGVVIDRTRMLVIYQKWSHPRASAVLTGEDLVPQDQDRQDDEQSTPDSRTKHHAAALAALEQGEDSGFQKPTRDTRITTLAAIKRRRPPVLWRMMPAIPASSLCTAGLFVFGWTANAQVHWIAPAIGIAMFGCGAFLTAVCTCLTISDRYSTTASVQLLTLIGSLSYMMAFAFSMFTIPMYESIGVSLATTVLGVCSIATWTAPWAVLLNKRKDWLG